MLNSRYVTILLSLYSCIRLAHLYHLFNKIKVNLSEFEEKLIYAVSTVF